MKPICVKCQRFYRAKKNGYYFIEGMPDTGALPGTAEPEKWHPYKVWSGDLWACEGCGHELISGTGRKPSRMAGAGLAGRVRDARGFAVPPDGCRAQRDALGSHGGD